MSLISRPPRVADGGVTTFHDLVEAGFPDIIDQDFDNDWDAIANVVNGHLDDQNIEPGSLTDASIALTAAIDYGKLNLTGRIVDADVSAVAGIRGAKLADAPNGVPTAKINDLAVTPGKLALRATLGAVPQSAAAAWPAIGTVEQVMVDVPALSSRGGFIIIFGTIAATLIRVLSPGQSVVTFRLYRSDNAGPFTLINQWNVRMAMGDSTLANPGAGQVVTLTGVWEFPLPFCPSFFDFLVGAGHTYAYQLRAVLDTNDFSILPSATTANPGQLWVVEFA